MSDTPEVILVPPCPNEYQFKLTFMKHEIIIINISSSNTSSSWIKMIVATVGGFLIIAGLFGDKFIQMYKMLVG